MDTLKYKLGDRNDQGGRNTERTKIGCLRRLRRERQAAVPRAVGDVGAGVGGCGPMARRPRVRRTRRARCNEQLPLRHRVRNACIGVKWQIH
eukprot:1014052-Pleurochrysis_carterae.AAC.1